MGVPVVSRKIVHASILSFKGYFSFLVARLKLRNFPSLNSISAHRLEYYVMHFFSLITHHHVNWRKKRKKSEFSMAQNPFRKSQLVEYKNTVAGQ